MNPEGSASFVSASCAFPPFPPLCHTWADLAQGREGGEGREGDERECAETLGEALCVAIGAPREANETTCKASARERMKARRFLFCDFMRGKGGREGRGNARVTRL